MTGDVLTGLSAAGVFVVVLVALARTLLLDRAAFTTLTKENADLRAEFVELRAQVARLEDDLVDQRSRKHKALNDVAKAIMALDLVRRLAQECKCGVLSPLQEIVDRLVAEMDTMKNRRAGDPLQP